MPKQNVPALRLEGFSGEWGTTIVSAVADVVGGGTPSTSNPSLWDGDIDWYSPNEVGSDVVAKPSNRRITVEGLRASSAQLLPAHRTILYTSRASIGHTAILKHPATTNQGFQSLVLRDGMDTYFMYSLTPLITRKALKISSGSTFLEISAKALGTIEIPVPPTLEEQQAIGAIFTNLDAAINQHTLKHTSLQQSKTALMQRMFPQEGQTVPELRLEGFNGEWEKTTLGELGTFRSGVGFPEREQGGTVGLPFYKVSDLSARGNELLLQSANHYVTEEQIVHNHWAPVTAVPAILFAKVGAAVFLGRKRLVNNAFLLDNNLMAFSLNTESWDVEFADTYLKTVDLTQFTQSGALPSLNARHLAEAEATIPPTLEEQQAIGAVFTNLDQLIAAEAQYIESLKQAKTALLQRMFI